MQFKNTGHKNRHTLYVADSGGGKSQALLQNPEVPAQGVRTFLFDPNEDHPWCIQTETMREFKRLGASLLKRSYRERRGFRLSYCGDQTPATHEEWCQFVFKCLDGRFDTYLLDEELAGSVTSAGKADFHHAILLNQARKGGGVYHATAQKSEEIPKTAFSQCKEYWVGAVDPTTAAKFAKQMPVDIKTLVDQDDLNFHVYSKIRIGREAVSTKLTYKNPLTVTRSERRHNLKF